MLKLAVGLVLMVVVALAVHTYLLPRLSVELLVNASIATIIKLFEALVLLVILAGFVCQEILHRLSDFLARKAPPGSRWKDLAFVLVALFGSGSFYGALARFAGW
jgi:hypothetical protein